MPIRIADIESEAFDPRKFSGGHVEFARITAVDPDLPFRVARVEFAAGARTAWHKHGDNQVLFVLAGVCRLREAAEASRDLPAGTTVVIQAGTLHWHGATPEGPMTHLAVTNTETTWMEPVSDAEYAGAGTNAT